MNKQNEATWLKILEKKENHYKLREKLVIEEVKKEIIEKIEKLRHYDLEESDHESKLMSVGFNLCIDDVINLLTLKKSKRNHIYNCQADEVDLMRAIGKDESEKKQN